MYTLSIGLKDLTDEGKQKVYDFYNANYEELNGDIFTVGILEKE